MEQIQELVDDGVVIYRNGIVVRLSTPREGTSESRLVCYEVTDNDGGGKKVQARTISIRDGEEVVEDPYKDEMIYATQKAQKKFPLDRRTRWLYGLATLPNVVHIRELDQPY